MITNIFISALGQAIFESCGQALAVYVALQLFMQLFPGISSKYKYDLSYLALTVICCWFLGNLIYICQQGIAASFNASAYTGHFAGHAANLPTLFQRAEGLISKYAKLITGLYFIGLLLHGFKLVGGFVHIRHIRQQKNLSQNSLWAIKAKSIAKKLGLVKPVALYFSENIKIPLTIGHLKPIIIFPLALINNLDASQVEAILMHELAHISRHDYLFNIIQSVMETILCFNPFAWLISKAIREQREYCCDDIVVNEECDNFSYSKALLIIAQQNSRQYALAMASTGKNKYPLLNRIKRLNTMETTNSLPKFHLMIIATIALLGAFLAWGIPQYSIAKTVAHKTVKAIAHPLNTFHAFTSPVVLPTPKPAPSPHTANSHIIYVDTASGNTLQDTLKPGKSRFKIVMEDDKGNKKEYNNVDELPVQDKKEFLEENPSFGAFGHFGMDSMKFANMDFKMNPDFMKHMGEMKMRAYKMGKEFNSPKFRKEMAEMRQNMRKQFDSPEWRKQQEDWNKDAEKWKKQAEEMDKKFRDSPEWKKQQAEMMEQAEKMRAQFDSPEWKKQVEDMKLNAEKMKEQFNSPEWKKLMAGMKEQEAALRKKMNTPEWKRQMHGMKIMAEKMQRQAELNEPNSDGRKQRDDLRKKLNDEVEGSLKKAEQDSVKQ